MERLIPAFLRPSGKKWTSEKSVVPPTPASPPRSPIKHQTTATREFDSPKSNRLVMYLLFNLFCTYAVSAGSYGL
jgi:hypothetical protein